MEVFGSSGARGVANEELTPEFVTGVAGAATSVWGADRVAVARDTRTTGEMFAGAATAGVTSAGADADRLGVVPTPAVQAYAEREGVPAVVLTASHNPPEYNGVKLVGGDGAEPDIETVERIEARLDGGDGDAAAWDAVGHERTVDGANDAYVEELLAGVDRERIAGAGLTVALDPGHGAGSLTSPEFLRRLGCAVRTVNATPDGRFPGRDPEPVAENLPELRRLVRATDADVGVAHDGDADRAVFVDETGAYVEGDATFAALAAAELGPGDTLVSAVNVSQRVVDVVESAGADLELTAIGSTNIMARIRELEAAGETVPVAGEGNGGVVFPRHRLARDGAYTAARLLELLAERPLSDVAADHGGYHNVRRNVPYESEAERDAVVAAAAERAREAESERDGEVEVTTTDGYRIDFGDGWVLARPSGTEPLVRVYAEARDADRAEELAAWMTGALRAAGD
ncbi:MAG: phosphoglucosamine mutase [Halobacteriaceae archaeon]